jgi:hypothetical protein
VTVESGAVASFQLHGRVTDFFEFQPEEETGDDVLRTCAAELEVAVARLR